MKTNRKKAVKLAREYRYWHNVAWQTDGSGEPLVDYLIALFDITEDELAHKGVHTTSREPFRQ